MAVLRLSTYPYVVVRIGCDGCRRSGACRLARLAERFGAETALEEILEQLSTDSPAGGFKRHKGAHLVCGITLPGMAHPTRPEVPPVVASPRLRIVGVRG